MASKVPNSFESQFSSMSIGDDVMKIAYQASNIIVRERMKQDDPSNAVMMDSLQANDVLVVQGTYDKIHLVMQSAGIPFTSISQQDLVSRHLCPNQTIYVNCPSSFPVESAKRLETFVRDGGQLITTDWALKHVIEPAFPNTIKHNGSSTRDEVVAIQLVDKDDDILKGFTDQEDGVNPVWWLEGSSYPIQILDYSKVKVLIRSEELKKKYNADPVVVSFSHGNGIVYHMISHLYMQRTETRSQKQGQSAVAYGEKQKLSETSKIKLAEITKNTRVKYGMIQTAATTSEFVSRGVIKQKKKYAMPNIG